MNTVLHCPGCGFRGRLPDHVARLQTIICPNCKTVIPLDQLQQAAETLPDATIPIRVDDGFIRNAQVANAQAANAQVANPQATVETPRTPVQAQPPTPPPQPTPQPQPQPQLPVQVPQTVLQQPQMPAQMLQPQVARPQTVNSQPIFPKPTLPQTTPPQPQIPPPQIPPAPLPQPPLPQGASDEPAYTGEYMKEEATRFAKYVAARLAEVQKKRQDLTNAESTFENLYMTRKQEMHLQQSAIAERVKKLNELEAEIAA